MMKAVERWYFKSLAAWLATACGLAFLVELLAPYFVARLAALMERGGYIWLARFRDAPVATGIGSLVLLVLVPRLVCVVAYESWRVVVGIGRRLGRGVAG